VGSGGEWAFGIGVAVIQGGIPGLASLAVGFLRGRWAMRRTGVNEGEQYLASSRTWVGLPHHGSPLALSYMDRAPIPT